MAQISGPVPIRFDSGTCIGETGPFEYGGALYAVVRGSDIARQAIFKSTDGGATWASEAVLTSNNWGQYDKCAFSAAAGVLAIIADENDQCHVYEYNLSTQQLTNHNLYTLYGLTRSQDMYSVGIQDDGQIGVSFMNYETTKTFFAIYDPATGWGSKITINNPLGDPKKVIGYQGKWYVFGYNRWGLDATVYHISLQVIDSDGAPVSFTNIASEKLATNSSGPYAVIAYDRIWVKQFSSDVAGYYIWRSGTNLDDPVWEKFALPAASNAGVGVYPSLATKVAPNSAPLYLLWTEQVTSPDYSTTSVDKIWAAAYNPDTDSWGEPILGIDYILYPPPAPFHTSELWYSSVHILSDGTIGLLLSFMSDQYSCTANYANFSLTSPPACPWLDLWVWRQLHQFSSLTEDFQFPPGYEKALLLQLAAELAIERFGKADPTLLAEAAQAFEELGALNTANSQALEDLK